MMLDQWRAAGWRFEHRGHSVFFRDGGRASAANDGSALLVIHGFPTASWDFAPLWPALTARFDRVLAPDLIGFGFSAKPVDYRYSIFDQADLCETLLREQGIGQFEVLAHDYGVSVAQELLARRHERGADTAPRLRSVCFLNGGLFPELHRPRTIQKLLLTPLGPLLSRITGERAFARSFAAIFGADTRPSPAEMHDFWRLIAHHRGQRRMHQLIGYIPERRIHRERWVGAMQVPDAPPLRFINGLDDPVSGAHMAARYREVVPAPDVVELAGIGHYPQVEAPEAVLAAFDAFRARLAAESVATAAVQVR